MKKLTYLFSAVALLCACEQADVIDQPNQGGTASGDLPEVIYATVADNNDESDKTRTVVAEDGQSILWNTGDAVSAFFSGISNAKYQYDGDDAVATAELELSMNGNTGIELSKSYAVYPYHEGNTSVLEGGVEKLKVNFPAEQTYAENSFGRGASVMVGVGETADDTDFYFRNACGYLVIKLKGEDVTVKSITLTALGGEKIAGTGLITAIHGAAPVVAMTDEGSSTITLNCGEGVALGADATEFWFAMPPTTFEEGFKILVAPTTGMAFEIQTSNKVEITRNEIQPMAALQYTPNAPAPNQIIYTRSDGKSEILSFYSEQPLDQPITKHYAHNGKFIIECADAIKHINEKGFERLPMETIILPSQLESIGELAFYGSDLVEIVIPGSVTVLHKDGFHNCDDLKRVTFLWGEKDLQINDLDGVFMISTMSDDLKLHESDMDYMYLDRNIRYADKNGVVSPENILTYSLASNVDEVIIGPNMSKIPPMAFNGADATRLVIPGNINYIGAYALRNLYELEELVIEPSPTNTPLTIEYDKSYGETGPFYLLNSLYDVLETIKLNREIIYNYQPTNEDQGVFSDRRSLTTVVLGEQVKTISDWMFSEAPELKSVTIQSALTSIGNYAFYNCDAMTSLNIPSSVTSIGNYAFYNCDALTSVTFPTSLTSIGNSAFENCDGITSVNVPTSVTTMGNNVFKNSDGITSATLGAQTIGTGVLYDCDELETVTIKGTVNTIGNDAFYSCGALKNVTFSPSPTSEGLKLYCQTYLGSIQGPFHDAPLVSANWDRTITLHGNSAGVWGLFEGKSALTSVTIGSQVQKIPLNTFKGAGLTSITIPANVSEIERDAFLDCDALHTVIISPSENGLSLYHQSDDYGPFYDSPLSRIELGRTISSKHGNQLFSPSETKAGVFASEESVDEVTVTIGSNVSMVGPYMFNGLNIKSIEIPSSVGEVSHNAFNNCDELTIVTVGAQIVSKGAFYDCDALHTVTIKGAVNTIGNDVFYSCGALKNVTFEESTTGSTLTIGYQTVDYVVSTDEQGPFYDAPLEKVDWRRNISYTLANNGAVDGNDEGLFSGKSTLTNVNIGAQVNSIPPYTFADAGFTAIWIPREVTSIGDYAFAGSSLQTLTCNHSTPPTLGTGVFDDCLTSISVVKGSKQAFIDAGWSSYGTIYEWVP
ncbi:MAG: leucine-rich repeat protein [Bacteroidaceae bacterium]|nr:leucine-rich repeat protein [Bacteroidaceae bacterium]